MNAIKNSIGLFLCLLSIGFGSSSRADEISEAMIPKKVIILGSFKDYRSALNAAKDVSAKTGTPFSKRDMVYDKKKGLIFPEDYQDESFAGSYVSRRSNDDCDEGQASCVTIERSEAYEGMGPDYYILVGGIYAVGPEENALVAKALKTFRASVPEAYAKISKIYMGCQH